MGADSDLDLAIHHDSSLASFDGVLTAEDEMDDTGDPTVPAVGTVPVHAPVEVPLGLLVVPIVPMVTVFIGETADPRRLPVLAFFIIDLCR
jgi:hypothetical protein